MLADSLLWAAFQPIFAVFCLYSCLAPAFIHCATGDSGGEFAEQVHHELP